MSKCVLLIRVSTEAQDLSQQTEKVKEEALKDYDANDIIILEDKESAVKLSEEERNGLNKLKWHIEHDDVNCVYAYEISRISRQPSILYSIRDYLISHNVQLIILSPYMKMLKDDGTLSEASNIFFGIFSSMAENEGYIRKQRMKRGVEKKREQGGYIGGKIAIGYRQEKDKIVIDEDGAKIVRRIFDDYVNKNKSVRQIARDLQNEGWRRGTSFLTLCQSVLNILHRKYYCGDKQHEALIDAETFEKARNIASGRTTYKTSGNNALLKGKLYDMETGYIMSSNMSNGQYYSRRYGHCTITMKAADMVASGVAREWYNEIYEYKKEDYKNKIEAEIMTQMNIISTMENNITDKQDKIDRIEERYIDGKISKAKADELEKRTFNELRHYKQELDSARLKIDNLQQKLTFYNFKLDDIQDIINEMIDKIYCRRLSRFICEMKLVNKITGEERTIEVNTRKFEIISIHIKRRDTLSYK